MSYNSEIDSKGPLGEQRPDMPMPENYQTKCIIAIAISLFVVGGGGLGIISLIFGILGFMKSQEVAKAYNAGNYALALQHSNDANKWAKWSIITTIILFVLLVIFVILYFIFVVAMTASGALLN